MPVHQVSVFIENSEGSLAPFTKLLGENGIDLIALSVADTTNFGILRAIVADTGKAVEVIRDAGYAVSLTDVLAVAVPDKPGGLSGVLELLLENGINVEYLYSFVRSVGQNAVIIFRVENTVKAEAALAAGGVKLLTQEEVRNL